MAAATVTPSRVTGYDDTIHGNERMHTRKLVFANDYAAGGIEIKPSDFDLRSFTRPPVLHGGVAMASALTTGEVVGFDASTNKVTMYELPSTTTSSPPLAEKSAEAVVTGCFVYATAFGR